MPPVSPDLRKLLPQLRRRIWGIVSLLRQSHEVAEIGAISAVVAVPPELHQLLLQDVELSAAISPHLKRSKTNVSLPHHSVQMLQNSSLVSQYFREGKVIAERLT